MSVKNKNIEDFYPLSPMQQGILFHSLAAPKSGVYFEQFSLTLQGKLNISEFHRAWEYVVERHSILRTCFVWEGLKEPVQIVHRQVTLPWQEYDWQDLSSEEQQQKLELLWQSDRSKGFELTQPPLMRLTLVKLSDISYNFTWSHHHLLLDGWSVYLIFKEVFACYKAFCNAQDVYLESIRPYRDYIVWLQQQNLSEAEAFWQQTLKGFTTPTQLSVNKAAIKLPAQTDGSNEREVKLSLVTTAGLQSVAKQHQLTLNTLLQGAWALLLSRYSGQEDVVFGAVTSGRPPTLAKVESMVGLLINTLPIRVQVSPEEFLLPWLQKIKEQLVEAREYEYTPLVKIQGWSEVPKDLSLFESIVVFENYPIDASLRQSDLNFEIKDFHSFEKTNYPITLTVIPGEELLLKITCDDSDRFDTDTITRMLGHLQTLLEDMVTNTEQRLCELSLLTETERHQLLVEWNNTEVEYPQQQCIHELFEAQVEKTPDAVAVVFEGQQLTYGELNAKANQLAHHLRSLGVKPEVLVGICVERSLSMVIGLLAILKAGGAYIPLDPAYPQERLAFILEDAQVSVLLTQTSLVEVMPQHKAQVVCLDAHWHNIAQQSKENLLSELTTDNLAYIIYTSGSTGKPKGVQITHGALSNFLYSMRQTPGLTHEDTLLAVTTYSFDIAALELFLPIIVGGCLVIASREVASDGTQLSAKLTDSKATVMQATPATWQLLLAAGWSGNEQLKILCGGEALPGQLANKLLHRCASLWNMYGPTETTIWSAASQVENGSTIVPISGAIANTQLYILDQYSQLVPIGVAGELHIGGEGLARGYFNRPDLTAEKFIPNPFSKKAARLYKTGDLARYLPNGEIEYIGRIDHQVKVRGFRIELGEIEAVISQYPAVLESVVMARKDSSEEKRLVAYLVQNPKHQGSDEEMTKLQTEQISQWQMVFDSEKDIFKPINFAHDPTFNISLWKSSYGGLPISEEEMHEWVDHTVEKILSLKPDRVLEIGCGNGLLLFRIAPSCTQYFGTDFSKAALHYTQKVLEMPEHNLSQVTLLERMADNFEGLLPEGFDTIIINSVVQYFPSIDYLLQVLEDAVNIVEPGGSIFVGDIRSLGLLKAFHTSVQLHNAPSSLSTVELQQRIQQAITQEEELLIDPAFFIALKHHLPQINHVQIQPKRGHYQNELTKFRYDVVLYIGTEVDSAQEGHWLDWQKQKLTLTSVRQLLELTQPDILGLSNVPNARLLREIKAIELLANDSADDTVSDIRQALDSINTELGLNPESLWDLKQELPYNIDISWINSGADGSYDVVFQRYKAELLENSKHVPYFCGENACLKPWNLYANNPLQSKFARQILPWLRRFLESKLPSYMLPTSFVILEALPLTPNGKVDRKALPISELTQISLSNIILPSTPIENLLAGIWAEVLGVEKVSIDNNFFELGGHSLIATRVIYRIRQVFQVELPLHYLFEKPTIAGLAKEIEKAIKVDSGVEVRNIERIVRSQELPLSFAQQRLWFLAQLEPNSPFYNMAAAVRLEGQLNVEALQQSFNEIISRHEALRTNFHTIEGQAIAVISEATSLILPVLDISDLPLNQQEAEVKKQASQEAEKPFDLNGDLLLRVKLLRLGQQEHILLLTMHHIVCDGWSIDVLVRELATLYQAFCDGQPSPLPELPIQYVDFAAWQRQWLQGEVLKTQTSYWLKQLKNAPKVLELPTDYPRPAIQTFRGSTYSFKLSNKLSVALNKFSQQQGSTLFMTLLAAFQTLLWRYTGSEDIVIGSPIANRNRAEIEGLIGFFVNTLVLRTNFAENPSFEELLKRVREVALGAYAHQDLPFELLVDQLQPERDLSHTPLFQVMFVLQNAPMSALELSGLTLSFLESNSDNAKFDLSLHITETLDGLIGSLEYNTDLFEGSSIQRMVAHLQTLLEGIVANPQQRLSELPLLTESERHQLMVEWNNTEVEYPQQLCIHQLFEAQVEQTPDAVAVIFKDQQLTYRELNTKANKLAHYLQTLGVKPEILVGICVERSLEMIIGLLGILKAGGAYVPLDPTYPEERLAFMLEDSSMPVLLTKSQLVEKLPQHSARVLCLDSDWEEIAFHSLENPTSKVKPENLAYIIYTSGSTGFPKGVLIQQRSLVNYTTAAINEYEIEKCDRVFQFASISFDASAEEIYPCLTSGATLVLRTDSMLDSIDIFLQKCRDWNLSVLSLPTAYWHELTARLSEETLVLPPSLRLVIIGGEKALTERWKTWVEYVGQRVRLVNTYGPTEATVVATICDLSATNPALTELAIGRPISNVQTYILDSYQQLVPIGVPGELHIGGDGLARGYLNRPNLTDEKFIFNPFSDKLGVRLYKTGDLARYLPNGDIEYIGRIDNQVKVRGFRIELGEIEAVINQHSAVREAVVVVRNDSGDSQRLVAYLIPQKEQTLTITELRGFLESKLPSYMMPTSFVMLEVLPLTPNGKVDRRALPVPDTLRPELQETFIAPQTTVEKQLVKIWAKVLGLEKIGINDNFFELGGDSILSIQVISKANQAGLHLTPKQIFQHQTIAQLATVVGTTQKIIAPQGVLTGSLELTPIQHWFFEQKQPEPHHWNQAVLLEVKQTIDPVALKQVVQYLQEHHDVLRLRFKQEFSFEAIIVSPDNVIPLTHLDLSALSTNEQAIAMEATAAKLQARLNLSEGPLFQVAIFDLGCNQSSRLLWLIHHLAVDGVSWRVLIEDLQTAYQQISQGKVIQLPPKTTSFKDWSKRLQQYARSEKLYSELDYWLTTLSQPVDPIPRDYPGKNNTEALACTVSVSLGVEETKILLHQVLAAYRAEINDVLLTALLQSFAQWTGENSLLFDLEGHGREELFEDIDLSRTVGWFTSVFPVYLSFENAPEPEKALNLIKEQLRAIPNRGVGYGMLRYLSTEEEIIQQLSSLPKAEVGFNYLGQLDNFLQESHLFRSIKGSIGPIHSPKGNRSYLIEVETMVVNGQLQLDWIYSKDIHHQNTITDLAQSMLSALRLLIARCQSAQEFSYIPSDFPEAELSQAELDQVFEELQLN
ncbi:amino acid adenylation domain-containing protein [Nostocales cyanobacterium LEGE 12452]|nr:amino acid adenylation domain-containing protein [Nostocales cyanobacterium LEGE 12452]